MKPIDSIQANHTEKHFQQNKRNEKARIPRGKNRHLKSLPSIELYQKEACPFSHAVRNRLSQLGLDYLAHNVTTSFKHEELIQKGGKDQIPYLLDHRTGVHLYESSAILAYLEHQYGKPEESGLIKFAHRLGRRIQGNAEKIRWQANWASQAWQTVRGSYNILRESFQEAVKSVNAPAGKSEDGSKVRQIRPVDSVSKAS